MERAGRMPLGARPARKVTLIIDPICCFSEASLPLEALKVSGPSFSLLVVAAWASAAGSRAFSRLARTAADAADWAAAGLFRLRVSEEVRRDPVVARSSGAPDLVACEDSGAPADVSARAEDSCWWNWWDCWC